MYITTQGGIITLTTDLEVRSAEEQALLAQQDTEFDSDSFQTPILKIGQPLTKEVQEGDAEAGEFINTLSGDGLGDKVEFIVAYYNKGRFASDKETNRAYVSFDDAIPESWSELVGEEWVGTPFVEYDDAEERFKERVNNKEIEWGHGPLVSTTHNYTGLVVVSDEVGSAEDTERQPARLSLQRTNMPAVRKFNSIKRALLRNKPFWDIAFELTTYPKSFPRGTAHLLNPKAGRKTEPDERSDARDLALALAAGRVQQVGEGAEDAPGGSGPKVEPDAKGGLEV